jgi:dTDP-4-amino-4,6-dideoxygalactose transaminase
MQGANVVFADVNLDDFLISIDEVKKRITSHTKAVIPVSLYGQVYDYQKLKILSEKYGFTILEDACQSV